MMTAIVIYLASLISGGGVQPQTGSNGPPPEPPVSQAITVP